MLECRYALDVNAERAEDVLMHKRLLKLAEDPANRPAFDVRLVQVSLIHLSGIGMFLSFYFIDFMPHLKGEKLTFGLRAAIRLTSGCALKFPGMMSICVMLSLWSASAVRNRYIACRLLPQIWTINWDVLYEIAQCRSYVLPYWLDESILAVH